MALLGQQGMELRNYKIKGAAQEVAGEPGQRRQVRIAPGGRVLPQP